MRVKNVSLTTFSFFLSTLSTFPVRPIRVTASNALCIGSSQWPDEDRLIEVRIPSRTATPNQPSVVLTVPTPTEGHIPGILAASDDVRAERQVGRCRIRKINSGARSRFEVSSHAGLETRRARWRRVCWVVGRGIALEPIADYYPPSWSCRFAVVRRSAFTNFGMAVD